MSLEKVKQTLQIHINLNIHCQKPDVSVCFSLYLYFQPIFLNTTVTENHSEDSYVPMASPPISCSDVTSDGYIPMSPSTLPISLLTNGKPELPSPSNPDLEPPPVNRNLKPRRRGKSFWAKKCKVYQYHSQSKHVVLQNIKGIVL